ESRNINRELALEKEALGFQNPQYLKKAQQLKPNLYDGSVIGKSDVIMVPDSENTLMHAEEIPKELHKVSMVNSCLKKLKFHLASFDIVVKERTTAITITEGTWGFEHTKAFFRDDIIPFVKNLKELFTLFDQYLIDEVDVVPLVPKLRKNRTTHIDYIKHTLEEAAILRELVESERLLSPLNTPLAYACKYTRRIQELL
nr:hypothetical protein [Tanacetum cinerariifolium]